MVRTKGSELYRQNQEGIRFETEQNKLRGLIVHHTEVEREWAYDRNSRKVMEDDFPETELTFKCEIMKTNGTNLRLQFGRLFTVAAALIVATSTIHAGWFGPAGNDKADKRATVRKQSEEMLSELYRSKPELKETLRKAAGYATFKNTDVHLLMLASANGYGLLVNNENKKETFMRVASLGGGVGVGVKDVRVIFIFHDEKIMKQFVEQGWQFGGRADAAAKYEDTGISAEENVKASVDFKDGTVTSGSSTDVRAGAHSSTGKASGVSTRGGMEIYQFTDKGLALQATVAGTKYWKDSKLN